MQNNVDGGLTVDIKLRFKFALLLNFNEIQTLPVGVNLSHPSRFHNFILRSHRVEAEKKEHGKEVSS